MIILSPSSVTEDQQAYAPFIVGIQLKAHPQTSPTPIYFQYHYSWMVSARQCIYLIYIICIYSYIYTYLYLYISSSTAARRCLFVLQIVPLTGNPCWKAETSPDIKESSSLIFCMHSCCDKHLIFRTTSRWQVHCFLYKKPGMTFCVWKEFSQKKIHVKSWKVIGTFLKHSENLKIL